MIALDQCVAEHLADLSRLRAAASAFVDAYDKFVTDTANGGNYGATNVLNTAFSTLSARVDFVRSQREIVIGSMHVERMAALERRRHEKRRGR